MISTHILDTMHGDPAANVSVTLEMKEGEAWKTLQSAKTNDDGRIAFDCESVAGDYRLTFNSNEYFESKGVEYFFLATPVVFRITNTNRKYHVPLLLNPYGYSTYRGS